MLDGVALNAWNTHSNRANRYTINETQAFQYIIRGFFPVLYDDLDLRTQSFYSSI